MTEQFTGSLPLYQQLKDHISRLIDDGHLEPDDQLPSEKELGNQFNVSRVTVRRALQDLANDGRIKRVAGKGSFVLKPKIEPLTALTSFSENMQAQGYNPTYEKASIEIIDAAPNVREALDLEAGEQVAHLSRKMLADGLPMALQDAYFPYDIYSREPSLFEPEVLNRISFYKILELELGIRLFRADEAVDAARVRPDEAELLELTPDDVVMIVYRTTYDEENVPVEFVKLIFPAQRYRYKVELFRPSSSDLT